MSTIIVVEDDKSIQFLYKSKLELRGFKVYTADDGEQGLHKAKVHKPDLMLVDLRMPVMSGDQMLAKLRETDWGSGIRIVVLTNISRDEAPSSLRFMSIDRYLVKAHHTPSQVVEVVNEILFGHKNGPRK